MSLAVLIAGGSDTRSNAEGHRQVSSHDFRLLKGAWREAARLRLGLPPVAELPVLESFAGKLAFLSVAAMPKAPTTLDSRTDRPGRLQEPEAPRPELAPAPVVPFEQALARLAMGTPAIAAPVTWPELPELQPFPLPALALVSAGELKKAQPARPAAAKAPPKKVKAVDADEPPKKIMYVSKSVPDEDAPAPVVRRTSGKAEVAPEPRREREAVREPAGEDQHRTFEFLSKSAP